MPLFIPFLIKGAIIAGKAIIASKKAAVVAKAVTTASKVYGTQAVASTTIVTLTTIGGVYWTSDRFEDIRECYELWKQGHKKEALQKFESLLGKIKSLVGNPESALHSGGEILKQNGFSFSQINDFVEDMKSLISEGKYELGLRRF